MIRSGKPEQLRMFMSAREITHEYAPNEPDRNWHGTSFGVREAIGGAWVKAKTEGFGRGTERSERTDQGLNFMNPNTGPRYLRGPKRTKAAPETDTQLYARKKKEAYHPAGGQSLGTDIEKHGVEKPIALGQHESPSGRPSLAGGHHRVAVMRHLNPDQLLPVLHVQDVFEAKRSGL